MVIWLASNNSSVKILDADFSWKKAFLHLFWIIGCHFFLLTSSLLSSACVSLVIVLSFVSSIFLVCQYSQSDKFLLLDWSDYKLIPFFCCLHIGYLKNESNNVLHNSKCLYLSIFLTYIAKYFSYITKQKI